jgi:hypothetical protein
MDEYRALGEEVCGVVDQLGGAVEVAGREPRAGEVGAERGGGDVDPVEDLVARVSGAAMIVFRLAFCQLAVMIRCRSPSRSASGSIPISAFAAVLQVDCIASPSQRPVCVPERERALRDSVRELAPRLDKAVELPVQRLEERPDDALVELLPEQRQVDELDERRPQLVTDLFAAVAIECR